MPAFRPLEKKEVWLGYGLRPTEEGRERWVWLMNPVECPRREEGLGTFETVFAVCVFVVPVDAVVSIWVLIHSGMTTVRISAWMVTSLVLASSCSLRKFSFPIEKINLAMNGTLWYPWV